MYVHVWTLYINLGHGYELVLVWFSSSGRISVVQLKPVVYLRASTMMVPPSLPTLGRLKLFSGQVLKSSPWEAN